MITMPLEHPEHPIVRLEGALVYFDTGAPQSLIPDVNAPWIESLGVAVPPMSGMARNTFERSQSVLSRLTGGLRLDALVGMDLITEHGLRYDLSNRQLGWGLSKNAVDSATRLKSEVVMGLPVIEMKVAGRKMRAILDTGCHMDGYFQDLPKNLPSAGYIQDESPIIGSIECPARYAEASLLARDGSKISLSESAFGIAPPALVRALSTLRVDGVLGRPAFVDFRVCFYGAMVGVVQSNRGGLSG